MMASFLKLCLHTALAHCRRSGGGSDRPRKRRCRRRLLQSPLPRRFRSEREADLPPPQRVKNSQKLLWNSTSPLLHFRTLDGRLVCPREALERKSRAV